MLTVCEKIMNLLIVKSLIDQFWQILLWIFQVQYKFANFEWTLALEDDFKRQIIIVIFMPLCTCYQHCKHCKDNIKLRQLIQSNSIKAIMNFIYKCVNFVLPSIFLGFFKNLLTFIKSHKCRSLKIKPERATIWCHHT